MLCKKIGQPYYLGRIPNFRLNFLYKVKPVLFCAFAALASATTLAQAQYPYGMPSNPYVMPVPLSYTAPVVAVPSYPTIVIPNQWQPQPNLDGTIGGIVRPSLGYTYLPMPWYTQPTIPLAGNSYTYPKTHWQGPGVMQKTR